MNHQQSKICLTAFYFGNFHNYFPLWLHSCGYNSSIDFILFTDIKDDFNYPSNVKRVLLTVRDFKAICQKKYDFPITLNYAYDICDYVPAFGDIFSDELKGYDFWGHCDMDLVFGDIRKFIPEGILSKYDKISWRGHFSLYKNTEEINTVYKREIHGGEFYKTIFTNPTNSLFAFEENEINYLLESNGYKIYKGLKFADLKTCTNNFEMMHFSDSFQAQNKNQVFEYINGKLFRHYIENNILQQVEFMYIHFLKRPMSINPKLNSSDHFLIVPNSFIPFEPITKDKVLKWSKKNIYYSYYFNRLNWAYYKKRKKGIADLAEFNQLYGQLNRKEYSIIIDSHNTNKP